MERLEKLIREAKEGNRESKEIIVKENVGLIWMIIRRFQGRGVENEDLFQIGSLGLLKSIEKFDFSYGVKFSTYAVPMIIGEIRRFLRDDGGIKISRSLKELANKARVAEAKLSQRENREITMAELAGEIGVSLEELIPAIESRQEIFSLQAQAIPGENYSLEDKLASKDNNEKMIEKIWLQEELNKLEPKERQIIFLRFFEDKTQTEVSKIIGISQVQISRIEKKILERIKKGLVRS